MHLCANNAGVQAAVEAQALRWRQDWRFWQRVKIQARSFALSGRSGVSIVLKAAVSTSRT